MIAYCIKLETLISISFLSNSLFLTTMETSKSSTFDVANCHLFRMDMGGYQGQNSVFLSCCAVLL